MPDLKLKMILHFARFALTNLIFENIINFNWINFAFLYFKISAFILI